MISDHSHKGQRRSFDTSIGYHSYRHEPYVPPLQVISSGFSLWFDRHRYTRQRSDIFGVELVTAGDLELVQDGFEYHILPGQVFFLRPGCAHIYRVGSAGFMRKRYIVIEGMLLESVLRATGLDGCDTLTPENPVQVERLFRAINALFRAKPERYGMQLSNLAFELLNELGKSRSKQHPQQIRNALDFMERNLHRTITVTELCEHAGLSVTHFNRLFRAHLKCSPMQFFIRQRMGWAEHLLLHSSMSVKEISTRLGYDNPLYFSSQFRKHSGISPRKYRGTGKSVV